MNLTLSQDSPAFVISSSWLRRLRGSRAAAVWAVTIIALLPALDLLLRGQYNILVAYLFVLFFVSVFLLNTNLSILMVLCYLFLLGDIRRIFDALFGFPKLDALIAVGPAFTIIIAIPILLRLRLTNAVSKAVLALTVVMVLEIFNPRQGSLAVGLTGALMYLIPLLWFWIGQKYGTPLLLSHLFYRVLLPLGVLAGVLGICQSYIGFLPWERLWIAEVSSHFASLQIGGGISRAFGYSVSAAEYANLMLLATLCSAVALFHRRRALVLLCPLLATALFLSGSRGSIFKGILGIAIGWAFSGKGARGWAVRLPLGIAVGAVALIFVVSRVGGGSTAFKEPTSASQAASHHQIEGLAHPLEAKHSTLGLHASEFVSGIKEGFTYPIGNGLGAFSAGTRKFGGSSEAAAGSEVDVSDAFVTSGLLGGILYLAVVFLACRSTIAYARDAPKSLSLPIVAMLASQAGIWMAIGQYSISPFTWLIIGSLSRPSSSLGARNLQE